MQDGYTAVGVGVGAGAALTNAILSTSMLSPSRMCKLEPGGYSVTPEETDREASECWFSISSFSLLLLLLLVHSFTHPLLSPLLILCCTCRCVLQRLCVSVVRIPNTRTFLFTLSLSLLHTLSGREDLSRQQGRCIFPSLSYPLHGKEIERRRTGRRETTGFRHERLA